MRQQPLSSRFHAHPAQAGSRRDGFTLVEMLTVIAIIALTTSLLIPNMLLSSTKLRDGTVQVSEVLEQAYSSAISRNTYVWVGLSSSGNGVAVASVYSAHANPGDFPSNVLPLTRSVLLPSMSLGTITTQITNPNRITASVGQITAANDGTFSATIAGAPQTMSYVIAITPSGQASISSNNKYAWMEIGLIPANGNGKNVSVLQMNAFTGRVFTFQP